MLERYGQSEAYDLMDAKIRYVDQVVGFMFEQGFARKFEEVGSPPDDLEVWYRNAQVYEKVVRERLPREGDRILLVTLIESIRFEAMCPPLFGEPIDFDVSAYESSEDVLAYKAAVVEAVLRQEANAPTFFEPPSAES